MRREFHVRFCEGGGVRVPSATRLVILCRGRAAEALAEAEGILTRCGLTLNRNKTRICWAHSEPFDLLGYRFGVQYSFGTGQRYLAAYPSPTSARRLKAKLRRMVGNHMSWITEEELVEQVNRVLRGWVNYFGYGTVSKTYVKLEQFVQNRLRGWLAHKHRAQHRSVRRYSAKHIYGDLGVLNMAQVLGASRMP